MKNTVDELKRLITHIPVKTKNLPEDISLNDILVNQSNIGLMNFLHDESEVTEIIPEPILYQKPYSETDNDGSETNKEQNELFLEEKSSEKEPDKKQSLVIDNPIIDIIPPSNSLSDEYRPKLEVVHEHKLLFKGKANHYYILGAIPQELSSLRITLMVEDQLRGRKERTKIDLYERESLRNFALELSELFSENSELIETELLQLTDLLEQFREKLIDIHKTQHQSKRAKSLITADVQKQCIEFLLQPQLIDRIDKMIEAAGVIGEENTRKLIYIIASTYKMTTPLHTLVQGSSGSGKSHLINNIGQCFPPEDILSMTRVTSKSFYHYTKDELVDKLILIQDYDGLDEEAQYAFRELQSAGNISSSTIYKDRYGNLTSTVKTVRSHFASLLATTKAEVYYDNMSRSVVIGVDESDEQTKRIIVHQNKKLAGIIDTREEQKAKLFLQNCMRCIKPYEVVNRYADKIYLPIEAKMLRRLNSHYQAFVKQITILHQYQRQKDSQGRLIAEPEDLKIACNILFDAIMIKIDDLDTSLRQFFDRMKTFIRQQANGKQNEYQFTQREVRLELNLSKASCFRYMEDLELLEYVQKTGGYANRGFKYKIVYWDDMEKIRTKIKTGLNEQLAKLNDEISE